MHDAEHNDHYGDNNDDGDDYDNHDGVVVDGGGFDYGDDEGAVMMMMTRTMAC